MSHTEYKQPIIFSQGITLNPKVPLALQNTLQEKVYLQNLEIYGHPVTYQLINNSEDQYTLQASSGEILEDSQIHSVYAFVILKTNHGLELRLGNTNHYFVANRAEKVIAAGDIYFTRNENSRFVTIEKITDQSGGYNISIADPFAAQKRRAARFAMQYVGLPMDRFHSFQIVATSSIKAIR